MIHTLKWNVTNALEENASSIIFPEDGDMQVPLKRF
jgi:hypothetical protein